MVCLLIQFFFAVAPRLTFQNNRIRNDVNGHTSLYPANVCCGLLIYPTKSHFRNPICSYLDSANSLFRTHSGMGLKAVDLKFHPVRCRGFSEEIAYRVAIQDQTGLGSQTRDIETLGT